MFIACCPLCFISMCIPGVVEAGPTAQHNAQYFLLMKLVNNIANNLHDKYLYNDTSLLQHANVLFKKDIFRVSHFSFIVFQIQLKV